MAKLLESRYKVVACRNSGLKWQIVSLLSLVRLPTHLDAYLHVRLGAIESVTRKRWRVESYKYHKGSNSYLRDNLSLSTLHIQVDDHELVAMLPR